jgi:protein arginine N-methyltransferase 1
MSRAEIEEHARYLRDPVKIDAYRAALREVVRPGARVLDLGAGTGLLGLLALEAGAGRVYAVDRGPIIGAAEEVARRNGVADRVQFVRGSSTTIRLPELVDVVVGDQIGGLAYDAGVLGYYADAARRLLAPGGVFVPGRFELFLAPVTTPFWSDCVGVWDQRPAGFDFAPFARHAANTQFAIHFDEGQFLGAPMALAEIDATHDTPVVRALALSVEQAGMLHGIAGVFRAHLTPSVSLTNCPLWPQQFKRWQNFYPLREPVAVEPDDIVHVDFDLRPRSQLATWSVAVERAGERRSASKSSTVAGEFLTGDDLDVRTGRAVPGAGPRVAADRYALELVDGRRSLAQIIALVHDRHRDDFRSADALADRVKALLGTHVRKQGACGTSPTD